MLLRAAIFDFDGLILDTESAWFAALCQGFAEQGAAYTLADFLPNVGTHNGGIDPFLLLEERVGRHLDRVDFEAACRRHERRLAETLSVLPGVGPLIEAARRTGLRLGVASSSSHAWVDNQLRQHGLFEHFDTVVCRGDAPRVKPAPDLYLEALRRLGVAAETAVAFEDSHNGSIAAKAAGLWCVAVPNAITRTQDFAHCDAVVASLDGFDLAGLANRLANSRSP